MPPPIQRERKNLRRSLSQDFIRAQALCLVARLGKLGDGARAAASRRAQAGREEVGRQREQLALYQAHVMGRGLGREGEIYSTI